MTTGSRGRRVMVGVNGWGSAWGLLNKFAYRKEGCASALSFTMTLNCKFKYHESINSLLVRILDFFLINSSSSDTCLSFLFFQLEMSVNHLTNLTTIIIIIIMSTLMELMNMDTHMNLCQTQDYGWRETS